MIRFNSEILYDKLCDVLEQEVAACGIEPLLEIPGVERALFAKFEADVRQACNDDINWCQVDTSQVYIGSLEAARERLPFPDAGSIQWFVTEDEGRWEKIEGPFANESDAISRANQLIVKRPGYVCLDWLNDHTRVYGDYKYGVRDDQFEADVIAALLGKTINGADVEYARSNDRREIFAGGNPWQGRYLTSEEVSALQDKISAASSKKVWAGNLTKQNRDSREREILSKLSNHRIMNRANLKRGRLQPDLIAEREGWLTAPRIREGINAIFPDVSGAKVLYLVERLYAQNKIERKEAHQDTRGQPVWEYRVSYSSTQWSGVYKLSSARSKCKGSNQCS